MTFSNATIVIPLDELTEERWAVIRELQARLSNVEDTIERMENDGVKKFKLSFITNKEHRYDTEHPDDPTLHNFFLDMLHKKRRDLIKQLTKARTFNVQGGAKDV